MKHYLNKSLKPIERDGQLAYPVYVQIIKKGKAHRVKSRLFEEHIPEDLFNRALKGDKSTKALSRLLDKDVEIIQYCVESNQLDDGHLDFDNFKYAYELNSTSVYNVLIDLKNVLQQVALSNVVGEENARELNKQPIRSESIGDKQWEYDYPLSKIDLPKIPEVKKLLKYYSKADGKSLFYDPLMMVEGYVLNKRFKQSTNTFLFYFDFLHNNLQNNLREYWKSLKIKPEKIEIALNLVSIANYTINSLDKHLHNY